MRKLAILAAVSAVMLGCGGGGGGGKSGGQTGPDESPWVGRRAGLFTSDRYPVTGVPGNGTAVCEVQEDGDFTLDLSDDTFLYGKVAEDGTISETRFEFPSTAHPQTPELATAEGSFTLRNGHTHRVDFVAYTISQVAGRRYIVDLEQ